MDLENTRRNYESERPIIRRIHRSLDFEDVIWDVGAGYGAESVIYATTGAQVNALEPEPLRFAYVNRNGRDFSNFEAIQTRVGSDTAKEDLPTKRPTVLTIDVEGAWDEVLTRLEEYLEGVRLIVVEVHEGVNEGHIREKLEEHGFEVKRRYKRAKNTFLMGESE